MGYTISTLIEQLTSVENEHGDLPVFTDFDGVDTRFSFVDVKESDNGTQQNDVHGDPEPLPKRVKLW